MRFQVITKVPDPADGDAGNMALGLGCYMETEQASSENGWKATLVSIPELLGNPMAVLMLRQPVFSLGEVVIVDEGGRELVCGQRKADKWDVQYETFDSIDEAVRRAQEVAA